MRGADRPSFDEWLTGVEPELDLSPAGDPAAWADWRPPARGPGASDTWTPTAALPESTIGITAVWTGAEMIVWGGGRNTGSRYDPATDTWTSMAMIGAPSPRRDHAAVWTGTEMIVWGGCGQSTILRARLRQPLRPSHRCLDADAVSPISARRFHTAVWTGTR